MGDVFEPIFSLGLDQNIAEIENRLHKSVNFCADISNIFEISLVCFLGENLPLSDINYPNVRDQNHAFRV